MQINTSPKGNLKNWQNKELTIANLSNFHMAIKIQELPMKELVCKCLVTLSMHFMEYLKRKFMRELKINFHVNTFQNISRRTPLSVEMLLSRLYEY